MMAYAASEFHMPRRLLKTLWLISALCILVFAAEPASAQFGGSRFPGMGGQRNPQGPQNPNASQPKAYGPTETLTGSLQQVSDSSLVLDAGDDRVILVKIQSGTKYLSTMGKVKASDFEPGDHVTVEATRDDSDHYFSKTITLNKKGTAEEKSAALQAANSSSHSGSGGDSSDSDPDRPRLHRANSEGGSTASGTTGSPASGTTSNTSSSSSSSGGDSGPPVLRRTSSAPQVASSNAPSSANASDSSGSNSVRRPVVSQPVSSSSSGDDSGPPVLRRNTPAPQVASSESSASSRPSLSAEDVNGVTRVPVIPPSSTAGSGDPDADRVLHRTVAGASGRDGGDPVIEQARDAAFSFSETLPNYVVKQLTNRYATNSGGRGRTSWQPLDIVTSDLIYEDGKERYTNIMVNGKPTKYIEQTGSWSEGEFASMLQAILSPNTNADFRNQRSVTILNRQSFRYDYTVEQPRSTWSLHADGQSVTPSYTGSIWIDKATFRVLRIEIAARNLPRDFPLDTAESSIDYDFVMIGDQKVLLPAQADSLSCSRGTPDCSKNHTEFHNYRKFGADTNITFEGAADK